jgi:hypothetical protein
MKLEFGLDESETCSQWLPYHRATLWFTLNEAAIFKQKITKNHEIFSLQLLIT